MKKNEEKVQRKIFQPTEETNAKIEMICKMTGMSLSELINSLFDAIEDAEGYIVAYNEAKEDFRKRLQCVMSSVLSTDDEEEQ